MVSDLADMFQSRLRLWEKKNKTLPENILIYRDGVSEGQYTTVLTTELHDIRNACAKTYSASQTKNGLPHISIIVVGKRHHTRFYPTTVFDADRTREPTVRHRRRPRCHRGPKLGLLPPGPLRPPRHRTPSALLCRPR